MLNRALLTCLALVACERGGPPPRPSAPPAPDELADLDLPQLAGPGTVAREASGPVVRVSPASISFAGKQVIGLHAGVPDPADLEGGTAGLKIPKLSTAVGAGDYVRASLALGLAIDRKVTYRTFIDVMFSSKQQEAGWRRFQLLARAGGRTVAIPITLPDKASVSSAALPAEPPSAPTAPSRADRPEVQAFDESTLAPDAVLAKISATYMASIRRCYKNLLKTDPKASGRLRLSFTVNAKGRVASPQATGVADACVQQLMPQWLFPIPKDKDGAATDAAFRVSLVMVTGDGAMAAPPTPPPPPPAPPPAPEAGVLTKLGPGDHGPLRMAVVASKTELIVWSMSGDEGTLAAPKLRVARTDPAAIGKVNAALADVVRRHWAAGGRAPDTEPLVLMADGDTPMQVVAELMAAIRATPDGHPLFETVFLSTGFE